LVSSGLILTCGFMALSQLAALGRANFLITDENHNSSVRVRQALQIESPKSLKDA